MLDCYSTYPGAEEEGQKEGEGRKPGCWLDKVLRTGILAISLCHSLDAGFVQLFMPRLRPLPPLPLLRCLLHPQKCQRPQPLLLRETSAAFKSQHD